MSTYKENFLSELESKCVQAQRLAEAGYADSELRDLINVVGSRTEIFLKTTVLPHVLPKTDFDGCINALKAAGVGKEERGTLHSLRQVYNDTKHTTGYKPSLIYLQELIPKIMNVVQNLSAMDLGLLNTPERRRYNRVLWLAAWDHYIGGDSEVHIIVPTTSGWPPDLDLIYIDMRSWDTVKATLAASGGLKLGKGIIPKHFYEEFEAEDNFHEALVVDNDYRTIIATLAAQERREELIPGLRREDDIRSMIQAFTLASIDVAEDTGISVDDQAKAIAQRAVETYAVPQGFNLLNRHAQDFSEMLSPSTEAGTSFLEWSDMGNCRAISSSRTCRSCKTSLV